MRIEQLQVPMGSASWLAQYNQLIIRVLQQIAGNGEPKRVARYADPTELPPASSWADSFCIVTDIDGLGNHGMAVSDGTDWYNVADGSTL